MPAMWQDGFSSFARQGKGYQCWNRVYVCCLQCFGSDNAYQPDTRGRTAPCTRRSRRGLHLHIIRG